MLLLGTIVWAGIVIMNKGNTLEVNNVETIIEIEEEVIELDLIDQSKAEIERISLELDAEETRILEQKAELLKKFEEEQARLDKELERIIEIRLSF